MKSCLTGAAVIRRLASAAITRLRAPRVVRIPLCSAVAGMLLAAMVAAAESRTPALPRSPAFSLEQIVATRLPGQFVLSPDRKSVVYTKVGRFFGHALIPEFGEDGNLVLLHLETGRTVRLTSGSPSTSYPRFSPDGRFVSYESDGDIWRVEVVSGTTRRLTTNVASDSQAAWSPDGSELAFVSGRWGRPAIYVMSAAGEREALRQITPDGFGGQDPVWSPDGESVLFTADRGQHPYASNIYKVTSSGGEPAPMTPADDARNVWPSYSPDGKNVAYVSDRSGFLNIWTMQPDGTGHRQLTDAAQDQYYPDNDYIQTVGLRWSPDGKRLLYFSNRLGNLDLMTVEVAGGDTSVVSDKDGSHHPVGWIDNRTIAFVYEDYRTPPDLYLHTLENDEDWRQVTYSRHAVYQEDVFDRLESVRWKSEDGVGLHGYLRRPSWASEVPLPALVVSHTYEVGQFYNQWNPIFSYIVQSGYVLLTVNHRGSNGYGTAFRDLPRGRGNWGFSHVGDLASGASMLGSLPGVDGDRIGILGYSMGGFLAQLAVTIRPEVFQAGVTVFGLSEVNEDPQHTAPYFSWHLGGTQTEVPDAYDEVSPVSHVENLTSPILIIHSDKDPIEPVTKVRNFVHELEKYDKTYELRIYRNEAHGLVQLENQLDAYHRVVDFLQLYLSR